MSIGRKSKFSLLLALLFFGACDLISGYKSTKLADAAPDLLASTLPIEATPVLVQGL